ncbi:hypothetical protein BX600DRAFT_474806 [Xylariales sp. PMI_506]|nr:hypothetical protein BX600DRAFT_474806 [Xylariales sp. PMI_506]
MTMRPGVVTVLPCTNIASATQFFVRLGFTAPSTEDTNKWDQYLILHHPNGSQIHLREIGSDEAGWLVPLRNPFGVYVYTTDVEALAGEFKDEIIESAKAPQVKEWGMYEFSLNGPDGCLVRVGWSADEVGSRKESSGL